MLSSIIVVGFCVVGFVGLCLVCGVSVLSMTNSSVEWNIRY